MPSDIDSVKAAVTLLFGSGKLIITGGSQPCDAEDAIEAVQTRLTDLGLLE